MSLPYTLRSASERRPWSLATLQRKHERVLLPFTGAGAAGPRHAFEKWTQLPLLSVPEHKRTDVSLEQQEMLFTANLFCSCHHDGL